MKQFMRRRIERALHALASTGAIRLRPTKRDGVVWVAGPEGGYSSAVLMFDLSSAAWKDRRSDCTGSGLFAAMRRVGVDLTLVTSALVADTEE